MPDVSQYKGYSMGICTTLAPHIWPHSFLQRRRARADHDCRTVEIQNDCHIRWQYWKSSSSGLLSIIHIVCCANVAVSSVELVLQISVLSGGPILRTPRLTIIVITEHCYDTKEILIPQNADALLVIEENCTLLWQQGMEYKVNCIDNRVCVCFGNNI